MKTLPKEVAQSIYYTKYLEEPGYVPLISLDAAVTEELFDTTVNMGRSRPSKWFQESLNKLCGSHLKADGEIGSGTVEVFQECQTKLGATKLCVAMLDNLDAKQKAEYIRLTKANPKLKVFLKGWLANRIGNVKRNKCGE